MPWKDNYQFLDKIIISFTIVKREDGATRWNRLFVHFSSIRFIFYLFSHIFISKKTFIGTCEPFSFRAGYWPVTNHSHRILFSRNKLFSSRDFREQTYFSSSICILWGGGGQSRNSFCSSTSLHGVQRMTGSEGGGGQWSQGWRWTVVTRVEVDSGHKGRGGQWSQGWRWTAVTRVAVDSGHNGGDGR